MPAVGPAHLSRNKLQAFNSPHKLYQEPFLITVIGVVKIHCTPTTDNTISKGCFETSIEDHSIAHSYSGDKVKRFSLWNQIMVGPSSKCMVLLLLCMIFGLVLTMIQSPFFVTTSNNRTYLSGPSVLPQEEIDLPDLGNLAEGECKIRNLPFVQSLQMPRNEGYGSCLRFDCTAQCDDTTNDDVSTNYDGPEPPCCTHVLRDMAEIFDRIMCRTLGLEYFSSYGMLLGLVRDDRIIPWTADNDYVVSFAVAEE
eukprot:scaffold6888_cov48-Attheya_sp.AAC.4